MNKLDLKKLVERAGDLATRNIWDEKAYKINIMILKLDNNNGAACTRLAKYYRLNDNISEAAKMYSRALAINPENRGAINNLNDIEKEQRKNKVVNKEK